MPYAYFPGCTLSTKAANYDASGRAVAHALGMTLQELPDWQCCGATFPLATDNAMALIAPTRMLAQTQKAGGHTTTLCAVCYHVLKRTQVFLDSHPEALERINWFTDEPYYGGARISHLLELLRDEMGWESLRERVVRPLTGLRVAPYYGCLLLRPQNEINLDDPDEPTILHDCLAALGCEVIDFPYKVECCGSYLAVSQPELAQELSKEIVESARRRGAELVVTACPLCQFNLDYSQCPRDARQATTGNELPIVYFTQLMAIALGLDEAVLGLDGHYIQPAVLARYGEPIATGIQQLG